MTNETRQRIEHYTKLLPGMKEKVMAATMMFVMALVVMVTATYAWITLSTAPEVTSVDTVVSANGSLEIALANGTGSAPGKSAEGDSTGAGNPVNAANITWGNLVNLSDASYGLNKITLRPAALNGTSGLLSNPLYGVGYGTDGRIDTMVTDDDFAYVYYDGKSGEFLVDENNSHLGVRAISTFYYGVVGGDNIFSELYGYVKESHSLAKANYRLMTNETQDPGKAYMTSLQGLMQVYAQFIIDKRENSALTYSDLEITEYVPDLYNMMNYFYESVAVPVGESYLYMTDMIDLIDGSKTGDSGYDLESLTTASSNKTIESYISEKLPSLEQYSKDYVTLRTYLLKGEAEDFSDLTDAQKINSLAYWAYYAENGGKVYWADLSSMINWICDINSATIDGVKLSQLSSASKAYEVMNNDSPHNAVIYNGAIKRMEQRIGQKMATNISVTVDASAVVGSIAGDLVGAMFKNYEMKAVLTTNAQDPFELDQEIVAVKELNTGSFQGKDPIAEDTYAMAIDLWLRTNAGSASVDTETTTNTVTNSDGSETTTTIITSPEKAYLTLEGTVVKVEEEVEATIKDANGDLQPAYVAKYTVDETEHMQDVFLRYGVYYYIDSHTGIEYEFEKQLAENLGSIPSITYTRKLNVEEVIVGYEGANRVWDKDQLNGYIDEGTSTTQGRGSCYIFYANTPADQSRFLELLGAMKVVFVNEQGRQIGIATLDTENYFAQNGRVTVPLVLDKAEAINLGTDNDGNTVYGLTTLEKNVATRITALVYLDGSRLTNEMVLASGDIQGTLNVQFGCSTATAVTTVATTGDETSTNTIYRQGTDSKAIKNDALMDDTISVSAEVDANKFDYDPKAPASSNLTVNVSGIEPSSVTARFVRAISSTQGVQQDCIVLDEGDDSWTKTCTFTKPGNYVLRTVWVDGVEYDLDNPITVTVTGSSVNSLSCDALPTGSRMTTVMTAEGSYSTGMTLGFTTSAQVPSTVTGIFMDKEGRQVNVPFSLEGGEWKGTAVFTSSGTFTMGYVEIDGEIYELSESLQPTLEIMLGLKVRTWVTASQETLSKLQQIYDGALATNFVLDTSAKDETTGELLFTDKNVTLLVSAEIYDNNGNEITGLSNATLYYGRAGSSVLSRGLHSEMSWSSSEGRYTGAFTVSEAGTFEFSQVTVKNGEKTNTITSYTSAPSIQAMPPDDAYYYNSYTKEYQYVPNLDASMTVGLAYSNAATKVTATITNGDVTEEVEGIIGNEAEDQGDVSVNLWHFNVPSKDATGSQEGVWQLTSITMYGVYYGGVYYGSDGSGVRIDLATNNIPIPITKVVNYINVSISGASRDVTKEFMVTEAVSGMEATISDYAGEPIKYYEGETLRDMDVSDVKLVYYLNTTSANTTTAGYTVTGLDGLTVDAIGYLKSGITYSIDTLYFQCAGTYSTAQFSFNMGGVEYSSSNSSVKMKYFDNEVQTSGYPSYIIRWSAPTAEFKNVSEITYINKVTKQDDNYADARTSAKNSYTKYNCTANCQLNSTWINVWLTKGWVINSYDVPEVQVSIDKVGNFNQGSLVFNQINGMTGDIYSLSNIEYLFENGEKILNKEIGEYQYTSGIHSRYLLGTGKANSIVLTGKATNGTTVSYKFPITEMTLNNLY